MKTMTVIIELTEWGSRNDCRDALACLLFNLALGKAMRDAWLRDEWEQLLAYADNMDNIGRFFQAVSDAFLSLVEPVRRLGLEECREKRCPSESANLRRPRTSSISARW